MDLVIDCKASIETLGIYEVNSINACVKSYEFKNSSVIGTVFISGDYKKQSGELMEFENEVPFTIVCKENNIKINNLNVTNFQYYIIINQSIECLFDIKLEYEYFENEVEEFIKIDEDNNDYSEDIKKNENMDEMNNIENDKIKEDIEKEYDEMLEEILLSRSETFISEDDNIINEKMLENKKIEVFDLKKEDNRVNLRSIKDEYSLCRIYYLNDERSIDDISKIENKSLDEILKCNKDYELNKKIILK